MPKLTHNNAVIYVLECNTTSDKIYGHTKNIYDFRYRLKNNCMNGKAGHPYDQINENGGYENWSMKIVEKLQNTSKDEIMDRVAVLRGDQISVKSPPIYSQVPPIYSQLPQNNSFSNFTCNYCNKQFSRRDNMTRHQMRICKIAELKKQVQNQQEEIDRLKSQQLTTTTHNNTKNTTNIKTQNNTNIQNNIVIEIGHENLSELLTKKQKMHILNKLYGSLEYLIEYIHCKSLEN